MHQPDFFKILRASRSSPDWAQAIVEATYDVPEDTLVALFNEAFRVGKLQPSDGIALLKALRELNAETDPAEVPEDESFAEQGGLEAPSEETPAESLRADSLRAKNQQLESQRGVLTTVNEVLKDLNAKTEETNSKFEAMIKSGK